MPHKAKRSTPWRKYLASLQQEILPKLISTGIFMTVTDGIQSEITEYTIQTATEVGLALLMDKPVLLLVEKGTTVSPAMVRAADIALFDFDLESVADHERVADAIARLSERHTDA